LGAAVAEGVGVGDAGAEVVAGAWEVVGAGAEEDGAAAVVVVLELQPATSTLPIIMIARTRNDSFFVIYIFLPPLLAVRSIAVVSGIFIL
jgi:hypothetical protein